MGILSYFRRSEKRASVNDPQYWQSFFTQFFRSKSGQTITPDSALQNTAVYACVRILAETVGSLPLKVYRRRKSGGKDVADDFSLYPILHDALNPEQTSLEFREMMTGHVCLRGNAYAFIERDTIGRIANIWPMNPANVTVRRAVSGDILYDYIHPDGKQDIFTLSDIWHVRGLSSDGLVGLSPVTLAREAIGLGLSAEDYGARFFANDARPGGVLEFQGKLNDDSKASLKKQWEELHSGKNAHRVAVLEQGLKWTAIGLTNEDAQFLETRKFQIEDIARIYRVPLMLIQAGDKAPTYASSEQFMLSFLQHTIRPWLVRWEQSITRCLLTPQERRKYFAEFSLEGILRGDLASRNTAYAAGRQWGWLSVNDIREMENMNPIVGGDTYLQPTNMVDANKAGDLFDKPAEPKTPDGGMDNGDSQ